MCVCACVRTCLADAPSRKAVAALEASPVSWFRWLLLRLLTWSFQDLNAFDLKSSCYHPDLHWCIWRPFPGLEAGATLGPSLWWESTDLLERFLDACETFCFWAILCKFLGLCGPWIFDALYCSGVGVVEDQEMVIRSRFFCPPLLTQPFSSHLLPALGSFVDWRHLLFANEMAACSFSGRWRGGSVGGRGQEKTGTWGGRVVKK